MKPSGMGSYDTRKVLKTNGAKGGTRTPTTLRPPDPKSGASAKFRHFRSKSCQAKAGSIPLHSKQWWVFKEEPAWTASGEGFQNLSERPAVDGHKPKSVESPSMPTLEAKVLSLRNLLRQLERVVVCFSGGVDSSYLLAESVSLLNQNAVALTAVSPSLAGEEGADARRLAEHLGARHVLVETHELDDPRYAANPVNRCYFCKTEVYGVAV